MLSAKSFRPYIATADAASKWLTIFISDIYSRMEEEGIVEGKRKPKTMTLNYRSSSGASKGRSVPIREITKPALTALAQNLLRSVVDDARAWPCAMLSLAVSRFEERETGSVGIRGFLVSDDAAKDQNTPKPKLGSTIERGPERRKIDEDIGRFFTKEPVAYDEAPNPEDPLSENATADPETEVFDNPLSSPPPPATATGDRPMFLCDRCKVSLPLEDQEEHQDWHFAKELAQEDRVEAMKRAAPPVPPSSSKKPKKSSGSGGGKKGVGGPEKGQRKLFFRR